MGTKGTGRDATLLQAGSGAMPKGNAFGGGLKTQGLVNKIFGSKDRVRLGVSRKK